VLEFNNPGDEMVFDGFGQGQVMRRKNQIHNPIMLLGRSKIQ
jgi:hypothetical protein